MDYTPFINHTVFKFVLYIKSFFQSALVQAIFSRNTEEVTFLLNQDEDVNSLVILSHINSSTVLLSCNFACSDFRSNVKLSNEHEWFRKVSLL